MMTEFLYDWGIQSACIPILFGDYLEIHSNNAFLFNKYREI